MTHEAVIENSGASSQGCECCGDFWHLHGHTYKSKGDATSRPKDLVKKAKAAGMKGLAVTDHGIASAWVEMAKACKEEGLKFIPGCEIYETNDRTIKTKAEMDALGYSTHHMVLLPMDNEGLKNLNRIISDASWNGQFSARNRTDIDTIEREGWGKGIIATSACLASRTSRYILAGRYDDAKRFALRCAQVFEHFYLELQDNNVKDQYIVNAALIQMSQETGLPLVYTQDYHYVEEGDKTDHDTWICIGRNNEIADPNRQGYDGGPYHFATPHEMHQAVKEGRIPQEAYDNTAVIANMCNVDFDFSISRFPKYPFVPAGYDAASFLRKKTMDAIREYMIKKSEKGHPINPKTYMERLEYELSIINGKGYADYFLILDDVFAFCRSKGILTGPGRGSGAGSIVNFLLSITTIDPIEHKLLFERFLNPERLSNPDIDYDVEHERRDEVFEYIRYRFGADKVAQIVTYGLEKLRSAVDDTCRVLKITDVNTGDLVLQTNRNGVQTKYGQELADIIKKTIPAKYPNQKEPTYSSMKELAENPEKFREDFRDQTDKLHEQAKEFMSYMKTYPEIEEKIIFCEGLVRNYGRHAAAVVITDDPITDYVPTYRLNKDDILPVTAFNMKEIDEDLQMLKLDTLSLSTLTIVRKARDNIQVQFPDFDIEEIPDDDSNTLEDIRSGYTTGVFQLSGGPITQYTKKVKPQNFGHLTDILALYRPGPLEALVRGNTTMAEQYCENFYPDVFEEFMDEEVPKELHHIYEDTRGILVYQEQLLQIAQEMAGFTLGGADALRKATGKKDHTLIEAIGYEFIYGTDKAIQMLESKIAELSALPQDKDMEKKIDTFKKYLKDTKKKQDSGKSIPGAVGKGFNESYVVRLYDGIKRFAGYSFNKSHSASYAKISYQTAYLKTHYPVEFMAAQLTVEAGDAEDTERNVQECRRLNIQILPPDVNNSGLGYTIEWIDELDESGNKTGYQKKAIRFGLQSIAGIGPKVVEEILRERDHAGTFTNMDDFFNRINKRTVNKGSVEKLVQAGCFDFDFANRYQMLNHYYFNLRGDKQFLGTRAAFDKAKKDKKLKADTAFQHDPKIYDEDVICAFEKDLLGFYLTHHPFAELPYTPWGEVAERQPVQMGGKITKIKKHVTKRGEDMAWVTLETAGGNIEVTCFPKIYDEYLPELFKGNIVTFTGRKETAPNGKAQLIADKMNKVRKKKFIVEKPPELAELAAQRKGEKKGKRQATLDDFGGVTVKGEPELEEFKEEGYIEDMDELFSEQLNKPNKNDFQDLGDLGKLFDF